MLYVRDENYYFYISYLSNNEIWKFPRVLYRNKLETWQRRKTYNRKYLRSRMVWRKLTEGKKKKKTDKKKKKKATKHISIININLYLNISDTQLIFISTYN